MQTLFLKIQSTHGSDHDGTGNSRGISEAPKVKFHEEDKAPGKDSDTKPVSENDSKPSLDSKYTLKSKRGSDTVQGEYSLGDFSFTGDPKPKKTAPTLGFTEKALTDFSGAKTIFHDINPYVSKVRCEIPLPGFSDAVSGYINEQTNTLQKAIVAPLKVVGLNSLAKQTVKTLITQRGISLADAVQKAAIGSPVVGAITTAKVVSDIAVGIAEQHAINMEKANQASMRCVESYKPLKQEF